MLKIKVSILRMYLALAAFSLSLLPMLCSYVGTYIVYQYIINNQLITHTVAITLAMAS